MLHTAIEVARRHSGRYFANISKRPPPVAPQSSSTPKCDTASLSYEPLRRHWLKCSPVAGQRLLELRPGISLFIEASASKPIGSYLNLRCALSRVRTRLWNARALQDKPFVAMGNHLTAFLPI